MNAVRRSDPAVEGDTKMISRPKALSARSSISSGSSLAMLDASSSSTSSAIVNNTIFVPSGQERGRRSSFELLWDMVKMICNPQIHQAEGQNVTNGTSESKKSRGGSRSISQQFRQTLFGKTSSREGSGSSLQKSRDEAEPDIRTPTFQKTWRKIKQKFESDQRMLRFLRRTFWMTKALRFFNEYVLTQDRGKKDSAFESFRQYTDDRERARMLLQSDYLFGVIHIMSQETCWMVCVERLRPSEALLAFKKAHLARDALSLMLEEMMEKSEWPLGAKRKVKVD